MKISLVVPVFNEQETIDIFYSTIRSNRYFLSYEVEIVFVNDGSTDFTEQIIHTLASTDELIVPLHFVRNFGKEPALMAGLEYATGDVVIPIDVDLQDPVELIPQMIEAWNNGAEIVLAKRINRDSDSLLKRSTAYWFYKLHNKISSPALVENVGDFRLLDRTVVQQILLLAERNLFMKGIFSWVGGKTVVLEYVRTARVAGHTKFNGWKLWNLAIEGVTNFSTLPLRVWSYIGFFIALFAFLYGAWMILQTLIWGNPVKGYPSLLVSILFLGGVQLIGIGVLGEYLGRVYTEVKQRPRYILKESSRKLSDTSTRFR
ncbi:Glycosyltransferase involved in cell wall bisynthesis [Acinetobacter marinus]|uniref:Glycosyltransferase involved in cell wall bisynthesis n=1 Tax=Acinetobacter marinus TaxID=281375 RepID=A0A1G6KFP6_9GAMM|nr:glycosyltransferase family 2 protein [Acinetobacter marinus]SDC29922.1 Glycosyltransferase involved in cell wall bisynthesis [Acinetobacter marinus]